MLLDDGIVHFAARQNLRQRVPDQLAGAQLALRGTFLQLAMMMAGHGVVLQNLSCARVFGHPSRRMCAQAHMLLRMRSVDVVSPKKK